MTETTTRPLTPGATTETVSLGYGMSIESVRALLFGAMVKRATPVVVEYLSDLFHDVRWLNEHLHGPMTFDWLARPSGTNIADSARIGVTIGAGQTARFYRITVRKEGARTLAHFHLIPLAEVASLPELEN